MRESCIRKHVCWLRQEMPTFLERFSLFWALPGYCASDDESAACLDNTVLQAGGNAELGLRAQHERRALKRWNPDPTEHSKSRQCPCSSQARTAPATVSVGNLAGTAAALERHLVGRAVGPVCLATPYKVSRLQSTGHI